MRPFIKTGAGKAKKRDFRPVNGFISKTLEEAYSYNGLHGLLIGTNFDDLE